MRFLKKPIYICFIIFISATYTSIRNGKELHVKIYVYQSSEKISQVLTDFIMIIYNYRR